jgi:hypothetical protein
MPTGANGACPLNFLGARLTVRGLRGFICVVDPCCFWGATEFPLRESVGRMHK